MRGRPLAFCLLLLTACPAESKKNDATPSASPAAKPPPSGSATPRASAAAAPSASTAPAGAAKVDLLWETPSLVAVSSRVDNPRDFPEHLVDRRPETAWNGRTGDLVGGFIAFAVPEDAQVEEIRMNAGFDRKTDKEDAFEYNVRVTKVRLSRGGKTLREVALDPSVRTPQSIPVGTAGGKFKIEVLAVQNGTKPTWRELAISELEVRGIPGKARKRKPTAPRVVVGGLDAQTPETKLFKSAEEACAKLVADAKAALDEDKSSPWHNEDVVGEQTCAKATKKIAAGAAGPGLDAFPLTVSIDYPGPYQRRYTGDLLALATSKGVVRTSIQLHGEETALYGKAETKLESATWSAPNKLVVRVKEHRVTESDGYVEPGRESEARSDVTVPHVYDCTVGDTVDCH